MSLEEVLRGLSKLAAVAKDAAAIRYGNSTATSITNYLSSPVFHKRPKLTHKGTKAAAAEAAKVAVEAEAAVRMEETKRLAAEYEAMDCGALTELALAAETGDPLRERWHAYHLLYESDLRADTRGKLMSVREAVAAETAAINFAVAAAATAAAAEAAAASKAAAAHEAAAKAAAAANERRALDVRTLSKKMTCRKSPAAARDSWTARTFPGVRCLEWGPGSAPSRRRRLGYCRASPRAAARPSCGLRPQVFARASTRRIPRPYIRGRICINS